jgi:two-component sensor histidine kinase
VQKFNGRIRALALTHELLVETKWRGVDLRQLLTAIWKAAWPGGGQAVLRGPPYVLSPECAQNVALAVHEMAANAASHLDESRAAPNVVITWAPVSVDGFAGVELVWREKSPTKPAPEPDFGLTLVEDLLPRATEGPSRIVYDDAGLLWTLRIDDKQLRLPN